MEGRLALSYAVSCLTGCRTAAASILQRQAYEIEGKSEPGHGDARSGETDIPGRGLPAALTRDREPAVPDRDERADRAHEPEQVEHVEPHVQMPVVGREVCVAGGDDAHPADEEHHV